MPFGGDIVALNATTVADDGQYDKITGKAGQDWFWAFGSDVATDRATDEQLN